MTRWNDEDMMVWWFDILLTWWYDDIIWGFDGLLFCWHDDKMIYDDMMIWYDDYVIVSSQPKSNGCHVKWVGDEINHVPHVAHLYKIVQSIETNWNQIKLKPIETN